MGVFRTVYYLERDHFKFKQLKIKRLDELDQISITAFKIDSLGYFNTVYARFEYTDRNQVKVSLAIPRKHYIIQLVGLLLLLTPLILFPYTKEYETAEFGIYLVYLAYPLLLFFMISRYLSEFRKKSKKFIAAYIHRS